MVQANGHEKFRTSALHGTHRWRTPLQRRKTLKRAQAQGHTCFQARPFENWPWNKFENHEPTSSDLPTSMAVTHRTQKRQAQHFDSRMGQCSSTWPTSQRRKMSAVQSKIHVHDNARGAKYASLLTFRRRMCPKCAASRRSRQRTRLV